MGCGLYIPYSYIAQWPIILVDRSPRYFIMRSFEDFGVSFVRPLGCSLVALVIPRLVAAQFISTRIAESGLGLC